MPISGVGLLPLPYMTVPGTHNGNALGAGVNQATLHNQSLGQSMRAQQQQISQAQGINQATCIYATSTSSTSSTNVVTWNAGGGGGAGANSIYYDSGAQALIVGDVKIHDGQEAKIELPDGTVIDVAADGSFKIEDKDAKVIYRASRLRDFNKFINVSDRLEEFIEFCGQQGVKQSEMLNLPLNLFIGWLAIEAAKADKEAEPEFPLLEDLRKIVAPSCLECSKSLDPSVSAKQIEFCGPECFESHYRKHIPKLVCLPAPAE